MRAFPAFLYRELLNFDVRDFNFWLREADRELTRQRYNQITAARLAMAGHEEFMEVYYPLYYKLKFMEDEDKE